MQHHEFVAKVRERGAYADTDTARRATIVVLQLLGQRLDAGAADLAARLPRGIGEVLIARGIGELAPSRYSGWTADPEEFLTTVATQLSTTPKNARRAAGAVLLTVREQIPTVELNQALSGLQPAYSELFGIPQQDGTQPPTVLAIRLPSDSLTSPSGDRVHDRSRLLQSSAKLRRTLHAERTQRR
jgi:uncharacterized protein (DUF2267 family)